MRLSVVVAAISLSIIGIAVADDVRASIRKPTNIPAQALGPALQVLAKERNFQVVYVSEEVNNLRTHGAVGEFTPEEALKQLLTGTGMTFRYLDENTVTIVRVSSTSTSLDTAPASADANPAASTPGELQKEAKNDSSQRFLLAQTAQAQAQEDTSVGERERKKDGPFPKNKTAELEQVVVTGSRIPTAIGQQVEPVLTYTKEDIERSGQTNLADFLNTLPDVSVSSSDNNSPGLLGEGQRTVQLHGLPVGTTLVLLNGYRLPISNSGFFDLSNIPVAAIERIEVLPVGASSIYGADALAGAVNIILRQNFNGLEADGKFDHAAGLNGTNADIALGRSWDKASVSLIGTYQEAGELLGSDRPQIVSTHFLGAVPGVFPLDDTCTPGNVYSLNGQNLPGLSSPQAGIPAGITGAPTIQQFAATSGKLNYCNYYSTTALVVPYQREGALFSAHYSFSEELDLFTEILASQETGVKAPLGPLIAAYGGSYGGTTLGANNPYNPFGETVGVSFYSPGASLGYDESENLIQPLVGIRGAVFGSWHYEATAYFSHNRFESNISSGISSSLQEALNSSDPATALNPFTTGSPGTPQLLQSLSQVAARNVQHNVSSNEIVETQIVLRGSLFRVPAGPIQTVVGSEYSHESQDVEEAGVPSFSPRRDTYAAFTEARIPLLADTRPSQNSDRLAMTLAGRYDHSSDFGGKATGQGGLLWRPVEALSFSGTYGISYQAPQLQEIGGAAGIEGTGNFGWFDPFRGNEPVVTTLTFGPNPKLKPETGDSRTLSVAYSSRTLHGLEASLSYFGINISDYIALPNIQTMIDNPTLYPGGVIRSPTTPQDQQLGFLGPITQINDIFFNFGALHVAGFDAFVRYAIDTRFGEFKPSLAIANIFRWQSALVPGSPSMSYLSQATISGVGWAPRWKGSAGIGWMHGPLSASLAGRYVGRYKDYQDFVPNSNELGNFWIFDSNFRYEVGNALAGGNAWLGGTYVAVGAVNLFDRAPQPSYYAGLGYDPSQYDIRGRVIYVQAGGKW
jgi:iron complex outermembrane receptor protein